MSEATLRAGRVSTTTTTSKAERRTVPRNGPSFGNRRNQKLAMGMTKAELIEASRYKVRVIAIKMSRQLPASIDLDDLIGMGYLGLMDAADRFDPARGIKFDTYAEFRIRGAILDELRKLDFISRTTREQMAALQEADQAVRARTGGSASQAEISKEMQMPLEKLQEVIRAMGSTTLVNLEDLPPGNELDDTSGNDPFRSALRGELKAMIEGAMHALPEQQQQVIKFYYFRGLNLKEIATIMDLTESRISQIHTVSIKALRNAIKEGTGPTCSVETIFQSLLED